MNEHGIIDVHAHIIPGVDDGSRSMGESIRLLKHAAEQGICGVIATPHYSRQKSRQVYQDRFEELKQYVAKSIPGFLLWLGQETYYHDELLESLRHGHAIPYESGRHVLIEFSPDVAYSRMFQGLRNISACGYVPVVAHVERYACMRKHSLEELKAIGCMLQMNYDSLKGLAIQPDVRWCRTQIRKEQIDLLGTDMHRMSYRPPEIREAIHWLKKNTSPEYLEKLTRTNPEKLIQL